MILMIFKNAEVCHNGESRKTHVPSTLAGRGSEWEERHCVVVACCHHSVPVEESGVAPGAGPREELPVPTHRRHCRASGSRSRS